MKRYLAFPIMLPHPVCMGSEVVKILAPGSSRKGLRSSNSISSVKIPLQCQLPPKPDPAATSPSTVDCPLLHSPPPEPGMWRGIWPPDRAVTSNGEATLCSEACRSRRNPRVAVSVGVSLPQSRLRPILRRLHRKCFISMFTIYRALVA